MYLRATGEKRVQGRLDVVDLPIGGRAARTRRPCRCVGAVHDAELVFVGADAELDVCGRPGLGAAEVRANAEGVGVPVGCCVHIVGGEHHRGEALQVSHRAVLAS